MTGHDLVDLADLLEQAKGQGVNILQAMGRCLPGAGYPKLKAYPHLAGPLRRSVAEWTDGSFRCWTDSGDDELRVDSAGFLQGPVVYDASDGSTGREAVEVK